MPRPSRFRALQPLPGAIVAAAAAIAGHLVRHRLIEPERLGTACEAMGPWWCAPRTGFIIFIQWNGFGLAALTLTALAAIRMLRGGDAMPLALLAMATGGAGLTLYNTTPSIVAVVAAGLILAQYRREAPALGNDPGAQRER